MHYSIFFIRLQTMFTNNEMVEQKGDSSVSFQARKSIKTVVSWLSRDVATRHVKTLVTFQASSIQISIIIGSLHMPNRIRHTRNIYLADTHMDQRRMSTEKVSGHTKASETPV